MKRATQAELAIGPRGVVVATRAVQVEDPPEAKRWLAGDRYARGVAHLAEELAEVLRAGQPDVAVLESPAGAQDYRAATSIALSFGTLRSSLWWARIPVVIVTADHAKKAASGDSSAEKPAVEAAMRRRWATPGLWGEGEPKRTKLQREAIADALAVATAGLTHATVRALLQERVSVRVLGVDGSYRCTGLAVLELRGAGREPEFEMPAGALEVGERVGAAVAAARRADSPAARAALESALLPAEALSAPQSSYASVASRGRGEWTW